MTTFASPDPSSFPDPPTWATWLRHRTPQFKLHKTLGIAKTACAGKFNGYPVARAVGNMYVYEWDADSCTWRERYFISDGTRKEDAPLFQQVVTRKKGVMPPSEKAVNAAIESIMNGG